MEASKNIIQCHKMMKVSGMFKGIDKAIEADQRFFKRNSVSQAWSLNNQSKIVTNQDLTFLTHLSSHGSSFLTHMQRLFVQPVLHLQFTFFSIHDPKSQKPIILWIVSSSRTIWILVWQMFQLEIYYKSKENKKNRNYKICM